MSRLYAFASLAVLAGPGLAAAAPADPALVAHGDYIIHGVGSCHDCHGAKLEGKPFPGMVPPGGVHYAPPLAGGPAGFTDKQLITFLETGVLPGGGFARPPMPKIRLNHQDALAVTAYLRSVGP